MKMKKTAAMLTAVSMLGAVAIPVSADADPAYFTTYADAYKTLITEGEQSLDLGKYGTMDCSENGLFGVDSYCLVDTNNDGIKELFVYYLSKYGGTDEAAVVAYDIEGSVVSQGIAIPAIYMIGTFSSEASSQKLFWLASDGEGIILHFIYGINPIYSEATDLLLRWNPYTSTESTREAGYETIYESNDGTICTEIPAEVAQYFGEPVEVYDADNLEPLNELIYPLAAPTITSALPYRIPGTDGDYIRYTWQPVTNADGYEVHISEAELGAAFGTYEYTRDVGNETYFQTGSSYPMIEATVEVRAYKETANGRIYGDWSDSITENNNHYTEYNLIIRVVDTDGNVIIPDSITVGEHTIDYSGFANNSSYASMMLNTWQNQSQMKALINPQTEISVTATKDGITAAPVTITATEEAQTVTIIPVAAVTYGDIDCNGTIDLMDAIMTARVAAEDATVKVTDQGKRNGDLNGDGIINGDDLSRLLSYLAGTISEAELAP